MQLHITVAESGADDERLEWLSENVRSDLLALDVDDVRPVPAGPRAEDAALLVSLGSSEEAIDQVFTAMRSWVTRGPSVPRTAEMTVSGKTLRLSDATLAQQDRLVEDYLRDIRAEA